MQVTFVRYAARNVPSICAQAIVLQSSRTKEKEAPDGSSYHIIVRDCLIDAKQNFISGDVITIYGEGDGSIVVYGTGEDYRSWEGPCINAAYIEIEK